MMILRFFFFKIDKWIFFLHLFPLNSEFISHNYDFFLSVFFHQFPANARCSVHPKGLRPGSKSISTENRFQSFPAGIPLQGIVNNTRRTLEVSLERLIPLVDYIGVWQCLPNISPWVLRTVERGVQIAVRLPPPKFNGVVWTVVHPEQGQLMEQEVHSLLVKEAIERVLLPDRESGFYSRYFIVPKKDGRLRLILDLRHLNCSLRRFRFKMLTIPIIVSQIRSEDWFFTIDLKDAFFHVSIIPSHRNFLRFAFGGESFQYRVLPFGLALSPRTFTKCMDAALALLRLQGTRVLNYIEDWLMRL